MQDIVRFTMTETHGNVYNLQNTTLNCKMYFIYTIKMDKIPPSMVSHCTEMQSGINIVRQYRRNGEGEAGTALCRAIKMQPC